MHNVLGLIIHRQRFLGVYIMYTCIVLVILVFIGGNEVEGNYTYVVCWGLKDEVVKVHKLVTGYF